MATFYKKLVLTQILAGFSLIPLLGLGLWILLQDFVPIDRIWVTAATLAFLVLPLIAGIQLMLFRRFNSETLIKGRAQSEELSLREIYLSNTIEQTILAVLAALVCILSVPPSLLKVPLIGSMLFVIGRALYFFGYQSNSLHRFTGFVLGHYTSLLLLGIGIYHIGIEVLSKI